MWIQADGGDSVRRPEIHQRLRASPRRHIKKRKGSENYDGIGHAESDPMNRLWEKDGAQQDIVAYDGLQTAGSHDTETKF
jgi:hypothetical protein